MILLLHHSTLANESSHSIVYVNLIVTLGQPRHRRRGVQVIYKHISHHLYGRVRLHPVPLMNRLVSCTQALEIASVRSFALDPNHGQDCQSTHLSRRGMHPTPSTGPMIGNASALLLQARIRRGLIAKQMWITAYLVAYHWTHKVPLRSK